MPKVNNKKLTKNTAPGIDWLWACILERQKVYGYDLKEMAAIAGVDYGNMRNLWRKSPWEWKRDVRDRVCRHFGINISVVPGLDGKIEVNIK